MKYKVSIIIPVYNAEATIGSILDKLISQSYKNIEIIAVNDGSEDSSLSILRKYAKRDNRLTVIDQANGGASVARNTGIYNATGDFITFIDSDDDISDTLISRLVSAVDKGTDFVMCSMSINGKNITVSENYINNQKEMTQYTLQSLLTKNLLYGPCCKLFNRRLIVDNNLSFPVNINYGEDTIFVLNYLAHNRNMTILSDVMYFYNLRDSGLSYNNSTDRASRKLRSQALHQYVYRRGHTTVNNVALYILLRTRWRLAYLKSIIRRMT